MSAFEVSVVIPSYQHGAHLFTAVQSAIHAGAGEVIIVDDASTDDTQQVGLDLQRRYPEVVYLRNDFRAGVIYSRNRAIYAANYELILPLDADDKLLAVEPLVQAYAPGTWVYGGWREYHDQKTREMNYAPPPPGMLHRKELGWVTMLFAKSDWQRVGGYNPIFSIGNEIWAFQRALIAAGIMPTRVEDVVFERTTGGEGSTRARAWAHVITALVNELYSMAEGVR